MSCSKKSASCDPPNDFRLPPYPTHIVLLGPPGSGKGTLCETLCKTHNLPHISTGDLLREEIKRGSEVGLAARAIIKSGGLVQDDIIGRMLVRRLQQPDCKERGYVLDGFPRTFSQVELLARLKIPIDIVIVLHVDGEALVQRMQNRRLDPATGKIYNVISNPPQDEQVKKRLIQREDDKPATIRTRLATYWKSNKIIVVGLSRLPAHVIHIGANCPPSEVYHNAETQVRYYNEMRGGIDVLKQGNQKSKL